jgi:hypothetical protein
VGLTILPCKKKIVEKPPRNSAGFCGGGQGLSWAVEPRKEEDIFSGIGFLVINEIHASDVCIILKNAFKKCNLLLYA